MVGGNCVGLCVERVASPMGLGGGSADGGTRSTPMGTRSMVDAALRTPEADVLKPGTFLTVVPSDDVAAEVTSLSITRFPPVDANLSMAGLTEATGTGAPTVSTIDSLVDGVEGKETLCTAEWLVLSCDGRLCDDAEVVEMMFRGRMIRSEEELEDDAENGEGCRGCCDCMGSVDEPPRLFGEFCKDPQSNPSTDLVLHLSKLIEGKYICISVLIFTLRLFSYYS